MTDADAGTGSAAREVPSAGREDPSVARGAHSAARRAPTAAEARALGHPTRLKIVFACREQARTNKELAELIGTTPGTIHYHLRPLVEEGFLVAEEPRPGPRGSREQPYRATGKTWEVAGTPSTGQALRRVATEELLAASDEDVVDLSRLGLTLPRDELDRFSARLHDLLDETKAVSQRSLGRAEHSEHDVESVTVFVAVHRQPIGDRRAPDQAPARTPSVLDGAVPVADDARGPRGQ